MLKKQIYFIIGFSLVMTSCSSEQLYQSGQIYNKNDCIAKSTSDAQYADCKNVPSHSYDEYEKERKELLEDDHNDKDNNDHKDSESSDHDKNTL